MLVTLNEVLKKAQNERYAVGLFNTVNMEMLQAAIEAAEQNNAPIIIGTAEVLLPYGELDLIAPSIIAMAKKATVPVVVHLDHGLTFERCLQAIKLGFSSIMFDSSTLPEKDNIEATRAMAKLAHSFGCSIEGEIGHVGGAEDGKSNDNHGSYTTVAEAVKFANATNVDALAVAVGTAHGAYKFKPVLDVNRIAEIRAAINTPLVLHGGSGLTDDDFKNTIKSGISKVNIFTDLCLSGCRAMASGLATSKNYLDIRNEQKDNIKLEVIKKMQTFGCICKAK